MRRKTKTQNKEIITQQAAKGEGHQRSRTCSTHDAATLDQGPAALAWPPPAAALGKVKNGRSLRATIGPACYLLHILSSSFFHSSSSSSSSSFLYFFLFFFFFISFSVRPTREAPCRKAGPPAPRPRASRAAAGAARAVPPLPPP